MKKRWMGALLALVMLVSLLPQVALAAPTVCFTSVNDLLLDLDTATMPLWSEGELYVSSGAFDARSGARPELGIYCNHEKRSSLALLYRGGKVLVFDLEDGTAYDNANHASVEGAALVRGERVFFPLSVVAEFFGLDYSYTKVTYGNLLRIKTAEVLLSDAEFIAAATQPMRQRYEQYVRSEAAADSSGGGSTATPSGANVTVCTMIAATDPARTESLLSLLAVNRQQAAFVFDAQAMDGFDNVLRRVIGSGNSVVLAVTEAGDAEEALRAIDAGNAALYRAAVSRTRLVYLANASEATKTAVAEAGYVIVSASDYSAVRTSQITSRILSAMNGKRGSICVYLGTDERMAGTFGSYLGQLRTAGCAIAALHETTQMR